MTTLNKIIKRQEKEKGIFLIKGISYVREVIEESLTFDGEFGDLLKYKSERGRLYLFEETDGKLKYKGRG